MGGRQRANEVLRALEAEGWTFTLTNGGHWRGEHPEADRPLFLPSTGGAGRGDRNALAQARRLLRRGDAE